MIDIRNGEIADILPSEFTRQPQALAISYALKMAYQTMLEYQDRVYVYAFVDGAPEYVLDLLAVELRVKYYSNDLDIETKRALIKTAMRINAKDGTKYAVDTVVEMLYADGEVQEWQDYDGENNHFRILLDADEGGFDIDKLIEAINSVKRYSSKLDGIQFHKHLEASTYYGTLIIEKMSFKVWGDTSIIDPYIVLTDEDGDSLMDENGAFLIE